MEQYKYNDFVKVNASWGKKSLSRFLCYRPDHDSIVVDHNGRLHEINVKDVEKAAKKDISSLFSIKLKEIKKKIFEAQDLISEAKSGIAAKEALLIQWQSLLNKTEDEILHISMAIKLMEDVKYDNKLIDQLKQKEYAIDGNRYALRSTMAAIDDLEDQLEKSSSDKKRWEQLQKEWMTLKKAWKKENQI